MSTEETRALGRRIMQRLDQRDLDGVLELSTPDSQWHGFAPQALDLAGYKQAISLFLDAYPDSRFPIEDIIAEGDKVTVRHSLQGTHLAPFQGITPSGKSVVVPAIVTFRVRDGKVAETWLNADLLSMLQQIGAIPTLG